MPSSVVTHTAEVTFTYYEIIEMLAERAGYMVTVNGMVYSHVNTFSTDGRSAVFDHITLYYNKEAS